MKRVIKQESPLWFEEWKSDFKTNNGRDAHYKGDFSTDTNDSVSRRIKLRSSLIDEQGDICCYCMKRITNQSSHIEHFWPKEHFKHLDMDYENLFASCNGEGSMLLDEEHCGHRKDNWWHNDMVPPTSSEIENMFKYSVDGKIRSVRGKETSNIAEAMIHNMGLDSYHLERNRRQAIEGSEVFDEAEYTDEDIRNFIQFYTNKDNGKYVPYCMAIVGCLEEML